MQLNLTTDYAIRIVLYLIQKKGVANSNEIAGAMGIPRSYILKIAKTLKDADILSEKRGVEGGFVLRADPAQLTLLDIVSALERTVNINRCLEEDEYCSRDAVSYCKVRELLVKLQDELAQGLNVKVTEFI